MTFLANKEMLLILDNFEHIMAGSEVVADILKAAPNVMVVVTSRERLKLTGETVFTLGGMDFPAWETPADALRYSAVQLFMQAATRARFDFELHDDNLDHLARICRLVQGTPLGIILAAGWVDTLPLEEIAAEMEDSIDFLETELTDLPERQRSIRAAFEYSWRLLTAEERHTFSQLSVFRGSCTHRAAKRVTGAGLRMLTRLANKSLLGRNPTTGRFELHELLRQIGAEHIDEALPLQQAHAEYYLDALATLTPELKGKAQVSALENISYDFENVRIAWLWALNRGRADLLLNAMEALALYCEMRNRLTDGYSLLQGVIDADLTPHLTARATLHHDLMDALGKPFPEEKAQAYTAALTLAADVDDPLLRLQALTGQASVHLANLRYSETLPLLQQALALTEDSYWVAVIHQRIGFIYTQLQQLPEAIDHTQRSYDLRKALGDTFGLSKSANNLGALAGLSGDSEAAQAYTHEAMTYAKQVGDLVSYGFAAANLASGFVIMGNVEEARQLAEEIITICERINSAARLAGAYYCRMNVALAEAAYDQALAYRDRVHTLGTSDIQVRAPTMIQTIIAHMGLGDFAAAKDVLRRLTSVMPEGNRSLRAYCLRIMAPMLLHQGEAAAAVTALARAHTPTEGYSPQLEPYPLFEPLPARLKEALGQEAFEQAWQRGTERGIFDLYEEMTAKVLVGS
jgi:predicted ATPase/Flp pilus assembly protein TadD